MVEGASSSDYRRIKGMLYDRPDLLHRILSVTADAVSAYLNAQIESGAQAVMIFDSWGGSLSAAAYQEFSLATCSESLPSLIANKDGDTRAVDRVHQGRWPVAGSDRRDRLRCGSAWTGRSTSAKRADASVTRLPCRAISTRRCSSPHPKRLPPKPGRCWTATAHNTGHVFNLGHGISQFTPPENVNGAG
jgi:uroporphyrinogen decarboxylase